MASGTGWRRALDGVGHWRASGTGGRRALEGVGHWRALLSRFDFGGIRLLVEGYKVRFDFVLHLLVNQCSSLLSNFSMSLFEGFQTWTKSPGIRHVTRVEVFVHFKIKP